MLQTQPQPGSGAAVASPKWAPATGFRELAHHPRKPGIAKPDFVDEAGNPSLFYSKKARHVDYKYVSSSTAGVCGGTA